jgi:MFS family permease
MNQVPVAPLNPVTHTRAKAATVLCGPTLVTLIPMGAAPALPAMAQHFGGVAGHDGAFFAQLVMTLPAAAMICAAPLVGMFVERRGRRSTLILAFLLFALAGMAALVLPDAWSLLASRLLLGCAGGAILTICLALAGDFPEGGVRERLLGFAVAGASGLAALMMVGGGGLVDQLGWRAPFAAYALGLPAALLAWAAVRDERSPTAALSGLTKPLLQLWPLYGTAVLLAIAMFMPAIQGGFLMQAEGVTSAATQGLVAAACAVVATLSSASFGWLVGWLRPVRLLAVLGLLFGAGALLMAAGHGLPAVAGGAAVMGVAAGLVEATMATIILARTPVPMHSRAMGLLLSAIFLGQFLNPWAVDPLRQRFGIHGAFVGVGVVLLALAALLLVLTPRDRVVSRPARA